MHRQLQRRSPTQNLAFYAMREKKHKKTPILPTASWQRQSSIALILLALQLTTNLWQQDARAQSQVVSDNSGTQISDREAAQNVQASPIQLFLPPVLEKGSSAWGSAFLADGQGLAKQAILVNGKTIHTDDYGLFSFTAPDTAFNIVVQDENKTLWETNYSLSSRGLLVSDKSAAAQVDRLDELEDEFNTQPLIMHAPAALETQQVFVVIGKNFSGKFGHDQINVDGFECDSFAGSDRSLVAAAKKRIPVGPVKEILVISDEESSLPLEVDLTRVEFRGESKSTTGNALDLELIGSNLPSLISLTNKSNDVQLRYGGKRLGAQSIFLSPGGQPNKFAVSIDNKNLSDITGHLIPNNLFDPYSQKATSELLGRKPLLAVNKAEIIRLKKRMLGLEERITLLNKQRSEQVKNREHSVEEENKIDSAVKSAAVRMSRLMRSLRSRRAILDADGMTESEWAQLNDSAADSMSRSLDAALAKNEFGFTESRLVRSSQSKKPKLEQDQYTQISAGGTPARSPLSLTVGARAKRWKAPSGGQAEGGRLIAPPAPYRFDPADLAPYFSDDLPEPIRPITSNSKNSRRKAGRSSTTSQSSRSGAKAQSRSQATRSSVQKKAATVKKSTTRR